MSAHFRIVKTPNPNKDEKPTYHVRFSANGTGSIEQMMSEITYGTTYTEPDVDGLLSLLQNVIYHAVASGYNIKLDGIGTFMPSLECPQGLDKKQIGIHNVKIRGLHFRPSAELMKKLSRIKFHRRKDISKPKYSPEERKNFLLKYLSGKSHITGIYYRTHTFISKTTAAEDLKRFEEEGFIVREGRGPTTFYRLK